MKIQQTKLLQSLVVVTSVTIGACKAESTSTEPTASANGTADRAREPTAIQGAASGTVPTDISASLDAARDAFNAHKGQVRFMTILSPTCGQCLHGAAAVRQGVIDNSSAPSIKPLVVWIPMFDDDSPATASESGQRFFDSSIPQFWDGQQRLGKHVGRSIGAPDWTAWDVFLFYPPGVEWSAAGAPSPDAALAQVDGVVIATKGTLPALPDQSRLPKDMVDKAEVVGKPGNLKSLLAQVAEPLTKRYAQAP
jgi:hypothetical protein